MAEFHKKEREELQKEHEQLFEALDGDRQKVCLRERECHGSL